jgi:L,D-peptidoglycan transpeptidase YkuD (ErfK/YbiS/YcfS/YnhG family)
MEATAKHSATCPGRRSCGRIWIHVDHGGPTPACISLSKTPIKRLLDALDPAAHSVAVLRAAASLAR